MKEKKTIKYNDVYIYIETIINDESNSNDNISGTINKFIKFRRQGLYGSNIYIELNSKYFAKKNLNNLFDIRIDSAELIYKIFTNDYYHDPIEIKDGNYLKFFKYLFQKYDIHETKLLTASTFMNIYDNIMQFATNEYFSDDIIDIFAQVYLLFCYLREGMEITNVLNTVDRSIIYFDLENEFSENSCKKRRMSIRLPDNSDISIFNNQKKQQYLYYTIMNLNIPFKEPKKTQFGVTKYYKDNGDVIVQIPINKNEIYVSTSNSMNCLINVMDHI